MLNTTRLASRLLQSFFASALTLAIGAGAALGQTPAIPTQARVSGHPDFTARTRLSGHVPTWASAAQDLGSLPASQPLDHVTLTLTRPAALEAAFQQLLKDQQDPSSPRYHQWLTPQQSAALYGVPQADSDAVVQWLRSQGLQVDSVSPTRQFLTVSGTASTVAGAFGVQLHRFSHLGSTVFSTTSEPAVPAVLAAVIQGVTGLSEEYLKPAHTLLPPQTFHPAGSSMTPDVTLTGGTHWLLPADFSVIYDVNPVYSAGITGTGQNVAIIGGSRVLAADITSFESLAGLASVQPTTLLTPGSSDPGMTSDANQGEATLDVDRVLGTAPGATAHLVLISSLLNTQIISSLGYIINTLNDPIINMSFGVCEAASSQATYNSFNSLFAQAAGQGISIFASSGDSEAAGCMTAGAAYNTNPAYQIDSINVLCTPYVTCVGGTQFSDTASPSSYWSSTNGTGNGSALSYIPEGVWNEPTVTTNGATTYVVEGGGGGVSTFATTKPTWQVGIGVPTDHARDTPDVSFSASGHNAYLTCITYSGASCQAVAGQTGVTVTGFGGTSAAAPSMAGITALVNQKTNTRQGLFNTKLYQLALTTSNGVFHDATPATSGVATCSLATASTCNTSTPGSFGLTGGVQGAALTTGYDLATGLGSIDVARLVTAVAATASLAPAAASLTASPSTSLNTGQSATFSTTITSTTAGTPTGTVTFTSNGTSIGVFTLVNGSVSTPATLFSNVGSYTILAVYSGDSVYGASSATLTLTVSKLTPTVTLTGSTGTIPPTQSVSYTATIAASSGTPTGTVTFYNGTTILASAVAIVSGKATFGPTTLTPGFYSVTAVYSGDGNFGTATSASAIPLIVTGVPTSIIAIPGSAYYATTNSSVVLQSNLDLYNSSGVTAGIPTVGPTGTITYNVDGTNGPAISIVGSLNNGVSSIYIANSAAYLFQAGVHKVTASYSGDSIWAPSTSAASTLTVGASVTTTTVALVTPGAVTSGNTTPITITVSGFGSAIPPTGKVTLTDYLTGGGTTSLGTFAFTTLTATTGTVSYTLPSLVTGTHQISAVFNSSSSDINYQGSNGSLSFIVGQGAGQSFTVASSPTSLTVTAGATTGNAFTATYTSVGGLTGTIQPSPCTVTANFSGSTVMPYCNASYLVATVGASTPGTNIFTLTTTRRSAITAPGFALNRAGAFGGVALSGLLLLLLPRRRRRWSAVLPILLLAAGLLSASGCGGAGSGSGGGGGGTTVNGTTAGSYTVTFGGTTGTGSTAVTVTTTATLNVQ